MTALVNHRCGKDVSGDTVASEMPEFGCIACLPTDPAAAWRARRELTLVAQPVDEPHLIVAILQCGRCGQHAVSVFTETIDWVAGADPQHWTVMPVTPDEAATLAAGPTTADLESLPMRRSLVVEHPADERLHATWSLGLRVPHHD